MYIYFLLHNILCNRITNDSLELILVMEKMQWGRLQVKLQEGLIFQLHEVIPWIFFFFTFRRFGRQSFKCQNLYQFKTVVLFSSTTQCQCQTFPLISALFQPNPTSEHRGTDTSGAPKLKSSINSKGIAFQNPGAICSVSLQLQFHDCLKKGWS